MKSLHNRRNFLRLSAAGTIGLVALNPLACTTAPSDDRKKFGVGIQLYTLRDAMDADVTGSLQKLSDLGYKYLELANYTNGRFYGYTPSEFKKIVTDMGMEIVSSHTQVEATGITIENANKMADDHAELGVRYCVQPWVNEEDRNIETYKKMVADWNEVGRIMKNAGIQFGYHNHNFEFNTLNGIVPYYDIFMKEMDEDLITMEIDFFWAAKAGQDPVEMFRQYPGRFQLFHMKDMNTNESPFYDVIKDDITAVGEGVIDFGRIMEAADIAGMKYLFVEDDNQGNGKPFESVEASITNLTTNILTA